MARKAYRFDARHHQLVRVMARLGASNIDIAAELDIDRGTVDRRFEETLLTGRAQRKAAEIGRLFSLAAKGSVRAQVRLDRLIRGSGP